MFIKQALTLKTDTPTSIKQYQVDIAELEKMILQKNSYDI